MLKILYDKKTLDRFNLNVMELIFIFSRVAQNNFDLTILNGKHTTNIKK